MKVLIDAHLPQRLVRFLSTQKIDAKHTLDLPEKNIETIKSLFEENSVIELDEEEIQVHY